LFLNIIFISQSQELEIEGSILLKENHDSSAAHPGTIRWTGKDFEGFNGVFWISLTGGVQIDTVHDVEGNIYRTLSIAGRDWMIDNLRTTSYQDGTSIPIVEDAIIWSGLAIGAACWYDNDSLTYGDDYGALYNWYAGTGGDLCPTGWSVPTKVEYQTLIDSLGGALLAGLKLKEAGNEHWQDPLGENSSGFTARPGGQRGVNQLFEKITTNGHFWTADEFSGSTGHYLKLESNDNSATVQPFTSKNYGMSIRCIKD